MRNTAKTIERFISMVSLEESVIKVTDNMTIVTTCDGRKSKVNTKDLTDYITLKDIARANDALAYTQFRIGRKEETTDTTKSKTKTSNSSWSGSEFGKIRYCTECGSQVGETADSEISVCPKCGIRHEYDNDEYTSCMDDEIMCSPDDDVRDYSIMPDFFDGYKWANRAYLKNHSDVSEWLRANRSRLADIKGMWNDGNELSLSMTNGSERDVSPEDHEKGIEFSTSSTEVNRKVIGLRTGFRKNLLRNTNVARKRLDALKPLVSKDEIERLEYLLKDATSVYEEAFKCRVRDALHSGIINMGWLKAHTYDMKGKMWEYTSSMNKAYWNKNK